MKRALYIIIVTASSLTGISSAHAAVLCEKRSGVLAVHAACKKKERPVILAEFGATGPAGPPGAAGMQGVAGPPGAAGSPGVAPPGTSTEAGILAPSRASQLVTLQTSGSPAACPGTAGRVAMDTAIAGNATTSPFSIPPNQVLVVTGVDWRVTGGPAGSTATANLVLDTPSDPNGRALVWSDTAFFDASGVAGDTAPVAGVVVESGTTLCWGATAGVMDLLSVHGFLAPGA
jgi:hypothetical protein